jgi:basic amino acid/polyamine antiporter, APA family
LLALLELTRASLHDVEITGVTPEACTDMAASETGRATWPAQLPAGRSTVSVIVATAIVVADMVGVGVFTSLGFQVKDIPSGFSILLLWAVGGLVALCGVFSYSELGAMFPRSSGEYNFLSRAFHPAFGFLAGWVSATVGFAAPVALAAMAFGEYGKSVLPGAPPLALAVGIVWLVSLVQLSGVRHSSTFQLISTVLKVVLIVAFLIAGFVIGTPQPISFAPDVSDLAHIASGPFAIGLVFVMYSFSGWNAATYITGEIRKPQQNLPRALLAGTLIVLVLYVGLNAVFLRTTPIGQLSGQLDVARIAGSHIFGDIGGRIVGAMTCIGLVSSISAMMWIGPRVMMTMGEDMAALRVFAANRPMARRPMRSFSSSRSLTSCCSPAVSRRCSISFSSHCCSARSSPCSASSSCVSLIPTCRGHIASGDTRSPRWFSCS